MRVSGAVGAATTSPHGLHLNRRGALASMLWEVSAMFLIRPIAAALAMLAVCSAWGQTYDRIANLVYGTYQDQGGTTRNLLLDLYIPRSGQRPYPLVVWIHGGAWRSGSKDGVPGFALNLCGRGYAVASIDYRLSDVAIWPAQMHDCRGAIRWLRANAGTYNLKTDRIGVWGSSAGGHLVAFLGTSSGVRSATIGSVTVDLEGTIGGNLGQSSAVEAVVNYYGPAEMLSMNDYAPLGGLNHDEPVSPESLLIGGPIHDNPELALSASPIFFVTPDDPPILHVHGTADGTVPFNQSERLQARMFFAGARTWLYPVLGAGHGGAQFGSSPVIDVVNRFWDEHLKGLSGRKPLSRMNATPGEGNVPLTVQFSAVEPFQILSPNEYVWAFGANQGATGAAATFRYEATGDYPATISARNGANFLSSFTRVIAVGVPGAGPGGIFRVAKSAVSTTENMGAVWVRVYREVGAQGPVTVAFRTVDGTSRAGQDYVATSGVLNFADGERVRTIRVPLIDDALAEPNENFQIEILNPGGGAVLGRPTATGVTLRADNG